MNEGIAKLFPNLAKNLDKVHPSRRSKAALKIGVFFSGGQASGGHNVVCALFDTLHEMSSESILLGFLGGPKGFLEKNYTALTADDLQKYRGSGGFDLLGSGRDKIESDEDLARASCVAKELELDGLVVIGGDDSNTNAAVLAEEFLSRGVPCTVVGVPKTIDGDLQTEDVVVSFGYDSAVKTYAATIGNIARDALSAGKYTFFIRLMGRSASHVTLECALKTHPNATLISEEIAQEGHSLEMIVEALASLVDQRARAGKNHGVILIPEGAVEAIPEIKTLLEEQGLGTLSEATGQLLQKLPAASLPRDPHGNVRVSQIESERLLIELVRERLAEMESVANFQGVPLFLGYEGRCCYPSHFDRNYCTALGRAAAFLVAEKRSGYMAAVENLTGEWRLLGVPLVTLLHLEERKGTLKPVIAKTLVDLKGTLFQDFCKGRDSWKLEDGYLYPQPIQEDDSSLPLLAMARGVVV